MHYDKLTELLQIYYVMFLNQDTRQFTLNFRKMIDISLHVFLWTLCLYETVIKYTKYKTYIKVFIVLLYCQK